MDLPEHEASRGETPPPAADEDRATEAEQSSAPEPPTVGPLLSETELSPIDTDALKVVHRLQRHGFEAYLVGGCVRDLILGVSPKDFDVATSATPEELRRLFRNCRVIGRRFRLGHIYFGRKIIETSTFRAPLDPKPGAEGESMIVWRDNVFGTAEEDARRRDFTMNGLFYDPVKGRVLDYVGGLEDLRHRRVRTIGDPRVRLQEDPVRILRAIKFAARLSIDIEPETWRAMVEFRGLVAKCAPARVLEEIYRLLGSGAAEPAFRLLHRSGVLAVLLPELETVMPAPDDPEAAAHVAPIRWQPNRRRLTLEDGRAAPPAPEDDRAEERAQRRLASELDDLVDRLLADGAEARARADRWTWLHLAALDRRVKRWEEPPTHALLLATALCGLGARALYELAENNRAYPLLEDLTALVSQRLGVSRRDRQELRQLLFAQRRMVFRGRRARPRAMLQKDYFIDAYRLLELSCRSAQHHDEDLEYWQGLRSSATRRRKEPKRPPRRRRRRRPRRNRDGE